jgi:hypothetical protein
MVAAGLFHEKGGPTGLALLSQLPRPCWMHWPRMITALYAFAATDHPTDAGQVRLDGFQQWLAGQEPDAGRDRLQMRDAPIGVADLDWLVRCRLHPFASPACFFLQGWMSL